MSLKALTAMFKPNSVAVVGATEEPGSRAAVVMRNILESKFIGPVIPLADEGDTVFDLPVYREVDTMPVTPDVALICTEPETIPDYVLQLGRRGTSGAVILSPGFSELPDDAREMLEGAILSAAKATDMRVLGPDSMGFISPGTGINASLAHMDAKPGRIAFLTQSHALFNTVLDWAGSRDIGFSHFISLGDILDLGFGSVLDYLCSDPNTRAVLMYLEEVRIPRTFMSAARAAARNKPVLVIKGGRTEEGMRALDLASNSIPGFDAVYDAAFRRAGMLRVDDIDSLFNSVETIARAHPLRGERLAVLTNGGSPGVLAADFLVLNGGMLAKLSPDTSRTLADMTGSTIPEANPVDIGEGAQPALYADALELLLADKGCDAVLVLHAPSAMVDAGETARAVAEALGKSKRTLLTCWLGTDASREARRVFKEAGIPSYTTPERAVRSFLHLVNYRRNQDMLMETPQSLPTGFMPETGAARLVVENALAANRERLSVPEAMDVLAAYDIPAAETRLAATPKGAASAADALGYPVALKVLSREVVRKTQAGGVVLDLESPRQVTEAAERVRERVMEHDPEAHVAGYIVQRMARRPLAYELIIGVGVDPVFGPFIRFGKGGLGAEIVADQAVALPPLNMSLARELVSRTRIHRLLKGHRERPAADLDALCLTLVKVSQMIIDVPEVHTLEINPLYADEHGVLALDAQILVEKTDKAGTERLAIRPYPKELEECVVLKNGLRVHLRPITPEDEPAHWDFISHLSTEDLRFRFFGYIRELPRTEMVRLTQIDYNREMAFIAQAPGKDGRFETLGVVRGMTKPDNSSSEFAIIVRSDMKGLGLGRVLMEKLIRYVRGRNTRWLEGEALLENRAMAGLAKAVGFDVRKDFDDDVFKFKLLLNPE